MSDSARLKATIYVGGLDNAVTTEILHSTFIPFGDIADISLPKPELPSNPDPHRGFGYVEFESEADAKEAIDNMDQSELFGRVIRVAQAKPNQKELGEGLGSKTAIWEQVLLFVLAANLRNSGLTQSQEGWLAKHAVSEEDRRAVEQLGSGRAAEAPTDPMQGLEGLDVAGPKPE